MKTRFHIAILATVALMTLGSVTVEAQMVASHSSSLSAAKTEPAPKTSVAPPPQVSGKVVARVNGSELIDRDLLREMFTLFPYAQQHNGFPKELEPEIRRGALQMIIFEELVYQEAKRRKMTILPARMAKAEMEFRKQFASAAAYQSFLKSEVNGSEIAMKERIRRALLIEALLNQDVNVPGRVSEVQVRAEYQKQLAQYKHGEILHIQSISIIPPNETKSVLQEAQQRANDALKQARQTKNYHDFGVLAEKISDDDFHVNMGDRKPVEASILPPPLVQAAAKMKPGDVSGLIQLGNNYTIFRLEGRTPAGTTPFAEVKAKLQADLRKQKTEQLRSALAQKLSKNAKVETL